MFNLNLTSNMTSTLGGVLMDFSWMTTSQIAALIIGIVLSVVSVATTFLAFKYASKLNSFIKSVSMALVAPFLAMAAWLFLIFSFLDGFRTDDVLNLILSILVALFICGVIIVVAKALYVKNREAVEIAEKQKEQDDAIDGTFEDQTNTLDTAPTVLLIENQEVQAEEEKVEENAETEENVKPVIVSTLETAQVETEEETTEEDEEDNNEVTEEENVEQEELDDIEVAENDAQEIEEKIETTEDFQEKDNEEVTEKIVEDKEEAEAVIAEDEEDDDDEDDEEFQKFLETLRARSIKNNTDKQDNE